MTRVPITVSDIYIPPGSKRSADFAFVVKAGAKVTVHKHSTREAAETARAKVIASSATEGTS